MTTYPLLDTIDSPKELRALPEEALPQLCEELRGYLLEVISEVGGHFSSSLGVVELTVALHYVLETPKDLTVWDVGHQAYIHKILTGRREALKTIRQYGGISGFLKRSESEYDVYGAGHASTALSAAYGMAVARDLSGENCRVAAVFGDGALTGGLCYEALNNAGGGRHRKFLAILNDNQMSISPNVGAIHGYLNNFVQTPLYQRFRRRVREGLERIPRVGKPMTFLARRIEEGAKGILTPGALFEALGFDYYGPVDGHDVRELVRTLRNLRDLDHPVLLHVLTVKGKGYARAEESPEGYHGVKPFCPDEGIVPASPGGQPAFQEVFGASLPAAGQGRPAASWASPPPCPRARASCPSPRPSPRGSSTWASPRSTPPSSRRASPLRACAPSAPSTRPSSSGPTTRWCTIAPSSTCPSSSAWTGRASRGRTAPRTTAPWTWPTCATSRAWS